MRYFLNIYSFDICIFDNLATDFTKFNNVLANIYNGCNIEKGCFGNSDSCVSGKNCSLLTTFSGASETNYTFEVFGQLQGSNTYVASALSFDNLMGNDSVIACVYNKENNTVEAIMYWNEHRTSIPLAVSLKMNYSLKCIFPLFFSSIGCRVWHYFKRHQCQ